MDIKDIKSGINPSGLDPDIEAKADEYAHRTWKMDLLPVLESVKGEELTLEEKAAYQEALFNHKYSVLEASAEKKETAKKNGLRWAS